MMDKRKDNDHTIPFQAKTYVLRSGQTLFIRKPEKKDAKALIDQVHVVDKETKFLAREPDEFNFTSDQEQMFIEESANDENRLFLIGQIEDEIVGTCSVELILKQKRFIHRSTMGIAVKKAYWRNGIGKIMMNVCINWCKENGIEQIELDVVTKNKRALSLYKSLGFEIYGLKKNALKYKDQTYADEHFMILFLNKD